MAELTVDAAGCYGPLTNANEADTITPLVYIWQIAWNGDGISQGDQVIIKGFKEGVYGETPGIIAQLEAPIDDADLLRFLGQKFHDITIDTVDAGNVFIHVREQSDAIRQQRY